MTPEEMLLKAKEVKTVEELLALAKENGIGATEEEIRNYFEQTHKTGELEDDELDNVAGGGCSDSSGAPAPQTDYYGMKQYTLMTSDIHTHGCLPSEGSPAWYYLYFGSTRDSFNLQCVYCNQMLGEMHGDPADHGYRKA